MDKEYIFERIEWRHEKTSRLLIMNENDAKEINKIISEYNLGFELTLDEIFNIFAENKNESYQFSERIKSIIDDNEDLYDKISYDICDYFNEEIWDCEVEYLDGETDDMEDYAYIR